LFVLKGISLLYYRAKSDFPLAFKTKIASGCKILFLNRTCELTGLLVFLKTKTNQEKEVKNFAIKKVEETN